MRGLACAGADGASQPRGRPRIAQGTAEGKDQGDLGAVDRTTAGARERLWRGRSCARLVRDLRSESGLIRSTLLHRLNALDVPWGRLTDAGRSRGTFRENWQLRWEPEFAVQLVEKLIYGSTIAEAAGGRLMETMRGAAE